MIQNNKASKVPHSDRKLLKKTILFVFIICVGTWFALQYSAESRPSAAQPGRKGPLLVRGYIATTIAEKLNTGTAKVPGKDIYLPGIKVYLADADGGNESTSVTTDLSGRFTLLAPKPGRYRVCWKTESFVNECSKDIVSVFEPIFVSTVRIAPDRSDSKSGAVIYGNVKMKDGSRPRRLEPLLNVNAFAKVGLLDKSGKKLREVFVNNFGEYVIAKAPARQEITLRAEIEGAAMKQLILPSARIGNVPFDPINLIIGNTPPRLEPIVATDSGGQRVKVARPGDKVFLDSRTSDKDGDGLIFRWRAADGSGSLGSTDKPETMWQLPNSPGLYSIKLLVWDRKGGYAESDLSLETGDGGIRFSGKVDGTDALVIDGAEVEVNGKTTKTNAQGMFSFAVDDAKRFVLNIRKPGYGLVSRIYDDVVSGGQWTMTKASTTRVTNPNIKMSAVERRDKRNCSGPAANSLDWSRFGKGLRPQWQDGKGNVIQPPNKRTSVEKLLPRTNKGKVPCGPGTRVSIPAGALEDGRGKAASGPVDISISTIDLRSPGQMPGDYTVERPSGDNGVMESYGAVSIDITSGGSRLNLKSGATATVTIPIDPGQLAAGGAPPTTIPLLFYDEKKGVWIREGTANLVGNAYVAKVKHFSTINMDQIKTNQSCVRILSPSMPANYDLEVTVPSQTAGAAPIVKRVGITNNSPFEHVVYNLPSGTNIVLVPIRQDNSQPMGVFIVNTGGAQNPTTPNLPVGPPYVACSTSVTLTDLGVPPANSEYLNGLFSFEATNLTELDPSNPSDVQLGIDLSQATQNYYDQIDPRNKRETLDEFKTVNGFGTLPEVRASFANSGDLGFGRDMHCVKQESPSPLDNLFDVACYVTNYGSIQTADQDDADQAHTALLGDRVATVAMEFSAIESDPLVNPSAAEFDDPERVVKFYVYNAAGDALLKSANLDGRGARPIPQLCMVCHNGAYPNPPDGNVPTFTERNHTKMGSRFLPFDLHYYTFPADLDKTAQQAAIKDLNDLAKLTHTQDVTSISSAPAITELINELYTPAAAPPAQNENAVVAGWNFQPIQQEMYKNVVARTCRTCHVANVFDGPGFSLNFDQSSDVIDLLGTAESRVCSEHSMPHAIVPHDLFWTSTADLGGGPSSGSSIPAQFQIFGDTFKSVTNGWNGQICGEFTPGGDTPQSFYETDIQPLWSTITTTGTTTACTSCHSGGSPDANLNLGVGQSYANIVNVDSGELPSMKRVKPGDAPNSYLFHKIEGTQGSVGGSGLRMPRGGGPPMNQTSRDKIRDWINSGAPGP